jgi:histidinol dehydrogenase
LQQIYAGYKDLKVGNSSYCRIDIWHRNVPKVYKIFGPGNQFVTVAKQLATQFGVAIDMPAGPSELLIVADDTAVPAFVASDLLSQAEHGADSQVILVSTSKKKTIAVEEEIQLK